MSTPELDYRSKAALMQARAKQEHANWVARLTPAQKANLRRLGVLNPPEDSHEVGGHSPAQLADIADSPLARVEVDFAGHCDRDEEAAAISEQFDIPLDAAQQILTWHMRSVEAALRTREGDLISIIVGGLLDSQNVKIACAGLAFATGISAASMLGTQAKFARSMRVSRTIISKSVKSWQRQLGLHTSAYQKSEEACTTYSEVATKNHWRKTKVTALELASRLNILRKKKS